MRLPLLVAALLALIAPAGVALADPGDFPGMPNQSLFGLCTAWQHNGNGQENGNAENAPPFVWLAEQAEAEDQTVEEFCGDVAHPGPP